MSWRELFSPVIARVIEDNPDASKKKLRKALENAFPANVRRSGAAYKRWMDEVRRQLGDRAPYPLTPDVGRLEGKRIPSSNRVWHSTTWRHQPTPLMRAMAANLDALPPAERELYQAMVKKVGGGT